MCGILSVEGPLLDRLLLLRGSETYLTARNLLAPADRWMDWVSSVNLPFAALAMLAVLARNYRAVQTADDRHRIRWVVCGTVIGLAPFFLAELGRLIGTIIGVPVTFQVETVEWVAVFAIPISLGYAIIRHRVFNISVVVRRGLRYLIAKHALRGLLLLPVVGLGYEVVAHRDQTITQLLATGSTYVWLIAAGGLSLRFRTQLTHWLDRRFFREAYDRERVLFELIQNVETLDSVSSVSSLVGHELEAAFHPQCLLMWYRETDKPDLQLAYSSAGQLHNIDLTPASPLSRLAETQQGPIDLSTTRVDALPQADRDWLAETGVRLIVPMIGSDRQVQGVLMLGDKKSDGW